MRSYAGMANRQGDVDLRFAQVSAPQLTLWLGLAWLGLELLLSGVGEWELDGCSDWLLTLLLLLLLL